MTEIVTAALLVIGDEILSGRTKDKNIGYIAEYLTGIGIELREVRVVADSEPEVVEAVNALRRRYTYLFTTGGIGPTHDDITADCVAKAFGVALEHHPHAVELMSERIAQTGGVMNEARMRMTRVPKGATLDLNKISAAPGFRIGNVIVLAGVPSVMQVMLDDVARGLETGRRIIAETIEATNIPEGLYGGPLAKIAAEHNGVTIGSYPSFSEGRFRNQIVIRSKEPALIAAARRDVEAMLAGLSNPAQ